MSAKGYKITDLINGDTSTFSYEVTPEVKEEDINNLEHQPLFYSITWHAKSHLCQDLDIPALRLASKLRDQGKHVLLHLSCDLLTAEYLESLLAFLREKRICNLLVFLGESFDTSKSIFKNSKDLLTHIKEKTGDYFCIGVVGFPDASEDQMKHLKDKVNSGADFIITQAFFEAKVFETFAEKCAAIDINVPIIPGIFLFETPSQLFGFTNLCKVKVPESFLESREGNMDGLEVTRTLLKNITKVEGEKCVKNFHFFTLNKLRMVSSFVEDFENN